MLAPKPKRRISRLFAACPILTGLLLGTIPGNAAWSLFEDFSTEPVGAGRFVQQTEGSESAFTHRPAAGNLTAVLDVDSSSAYYLSNLLSPITDAGEEISFSARFPVDGMDDQATPNAFYRADYNHSPGTVCRWSNPGPVPLDRAGGWPTPASIIIFSVCGSTLKLTSNRISCWGGFRQPSGDFLCNFSGQKTNLGASPRGACLPPQM